MLLKLSIQLHGLSHVSSNMAENSQETMGKLIDSILLSRFMNWFKYGIGKVGFLGKGIMFLKHIIYNNKIYNLDKKYYERKYFG